MAIRIYVLPMNEAPVNGSIYRAPMYIGGRNQPPAVAGLEGLSYGCIDYGFQPVAILAAEVTSAQHTILNSQPNVLALPANLAGNLTTGAVNTTKTLLEFLYVPANWVNTSLTYAGVLHKVAWIFLFMQRLHGIYPVKLFNGTNTLATTFGDLAPEMQAGLLSAADSLSIDTSSVISTTTIRQFLILMSVALNSVPINLFGLMI